MYHTAGSPGRRAAGVICALVLAACLATLCLFYVVHPGGRASLSSPVSGTAGVGGGGAEQTARAWGHTAAAVSQPSKTWYLAEGSTGEGFETWVLVGNPRADEATVRLTFITAAGPVEGPTLSLPPFTRKTVNAADTAPDEAEVACVVESDTPVVAERAVYGGARRWAHCSAGVCEPATTWYLAEGSTGEGFETWVLVFNPGASPAEVGVTFMTDTGGVEGPAFTLPAMTRRTINVADTVPGTWEVSTCVESNAPVVVERAAYGAGGTWATCSAGLTSPEQSWYMAEGTTAAGSETWVLVQNPFATAADLSVSYMTPSGTVPGPAARIEPFSRRSFFAADVVPGEWEVSAEVSSDNPVVAERAVYGPGRAWATGSAAVPTGGTTWYMAEGSTGSGLETWVLLENPSGSECTTHLTYLTESGPVQGPTCALQPGTRHSVNLADTVPGRWDVSTVVSSDGPVVVERAMYGERASTVGSRTLMEGTVFETTAYTLTGGGCPAGSPTVMVMGGVHGNEDAGFKTAETLTRAAVSRGKLVAVPHTNQAAISIHARFYNKDLNRCFPGVEEGTAEDRLAWELMELARDSDIDLLLNLHSADNFHLADPDAVGQTIILDDQAIAVQAGRACDTANLSITDPIEKYSLLLWPIPTSATYAVYYGEGKPAFGVEVCEKMDLARQCAEQLLVIKAFAEQAGVMIDNWDELLR
ncbi:MAG: succinylglutamate desuccinylase/aspartoacylase family protein [Actinobacteria bacterium]|nr:succinylglutamate desuccinylase/aspartoacylase family protein [Actinomycetota bacterium]MBU1943349.1 succinylglutamate desuccinylase/aspartoacylase family protein [Actinomycetota bacterium]MBU2686533.1 succinylglutamate desuccinylase/aspartoacylase family protein [Actinomycetota bacterium]